jgi:glycosyltransferase involved in cell wall biosynthesis
VGRGVTRIAYLVHNLADAAVARRIKMLRAAGADVVVLGFCRDEVPPAQVAGVQAISLGRTRDAALVQRAAQVGANLLRSAPLLDGCRGADVIIARNLETLALGRWAQARLGGVQLVYESLDIHRSLLGQGLKSRAMRGLERWLMKSCALLLTSSPAFLRDYFVPVQGLGVPSLLVENKLLALDGDPGAPPEGPPPGPPWTIGWFGNLRCRKTLAALLSLADRGEGRVRILIAGKASPAEFPDFAEQVRRPHVDFLGPYRADELLGLYAQCHFAWAIDYFEEGLNSTWLLPNRLYEASSFGVVPVALDSVETGRWLAGHGAGLLLCAGAELAQLEARIAELDGEAYGLLRHAVLTIPRGDLVAGRDECRELLGAIAG